MATDLSPRPVPPRHGLLSVLLVTLVGFLASCGVFASQPAGQTATPPMESPQPTSIAAGPDGNLWFIDNGRNQIGRISPGGRVTEFPLPEAQVYPDVITAEPTSGTGNKIGRISPSGAVTLFSVSTAGAITAGPDGSLWFTEWASNKIGRITAG